MIPLLRDISSRGALLYLHTCLPSLAPVHVDWSHGSFATVGLQVAQSRSQLHSIGPKVAIV